MNYRKIILTFIILFYLEIIYHFSVFHAFQAKNIFFIIIFTFLASLFIDMITNLFNHKINKWIFTFTIWIISLIFIAQFINYKFYGNVLSIYSIFNGGQVFGFFSQILHVMNNNYLTIALLIMPATLLLIFNRRLLIFDVNYRYLGLKTSFFIISYILCMFFINFDRNDIYSASNVYYHKHVPNQTAQILGLMTAMRLDIERLITNFQETVDITITPNDSIPNIEITYNVLDIDFNKLIENTTDKTIKNIHTYIANSTPSPQNEYTGYFAGKNLIVITAEAFSPIAVDPILTPTLYKLVNNGFKFNNFYTPIYYVSTSDGEYANLLSLLPKENMWSMRASSGNYLPYAYGNVFKSLDYNTNAYHNGTYTYYGRDKSHPNMGYKYTACGNGLQKLMNCKIWPQSDVDMIKTTINNYINDSSFMTYYMTISGHLEYNFFGNNMAYKNKKYVEELNNYSLAIKAYIATQIELDRALEILISELETKGILDDTVIVMSADHYPYGLKASEMKELMDIEDESMDIHKNHLIIWNNTMTTPIEVNKYGNSIDILPTVLNLFGIEYDSRLLMGRDLLSDTDGLVIFNNRSWITEYGKYNATDKTFKPFKSNIPNDYIETINNEVYNKFVISRNILETDYYKYIFKEN